MARGIPEPFFSARMRIKKTGTGRPIPVRFLMLGIYIANNMNTWAHSTRRNIAKG